MKLATSFSKFRRASLHRRRVSGNYLRRALSGALLFERLEDRRLLAVDIELVRDLASTIESSGSAPSQFTQVGSQVFFRASTEESGSELWVSDGSAAGTRLVDDINHGGDSSTPTFLTAFNGALYFAADDGVSGRELWTSDGMITKRVKDIYSGSSGSTPTSFAIVYGELYFAAQDYNNGRELWKTDGTAVGTVLAHDINPTGNSNPDDLVSSFGRLYFAAENASHGRSVWLAYNGSLTPLDVPIGSVGSDPKDLTVVGNNLFYSTDSATNGRELKRTPIGSTNTWFVGDINPGIGDSNPHNLTNVDGELYFAADDGSTGIELWKNTGSGNSTQVADINPGSGSSNPAELTKLAGRLLFTADGGTWGTELWNTNLSVGSTLQIKDIRPGSGASSPTGLTVVGSEVYFAALNNFNGYELWKTNGLASGTVAVAEASGVTPSENGNMIDFSGNLLFSADDGGIGRELWVHSSVGGTQLVADIDTATLSASPRDFVEIDGITYFSAFSQGTGRELWKTDGTRQGTKLVMDISPGPIGSNPTELTHANGRLYFEADDGVHGRELWVTDGTQGGTYLVADINPASSSSPDKLTSVGEYLFFSAYDGADGRELWATSTISGSTFIVDHNIAPGSTSSTPTELTNVGGVLFFSAWNSTYGRELWVTRPHDYGALGPSANLVEDIYIGTLSSTPTELTNVDGKLFFTARNYFYGYELHSSDGSSAGTGIVSDIYTGSGNSSTPKELTVVNGDLYFTAYVSGTGRELWRRRGVNGYVHLVEDIATGYLSSSPEELTEIDNVLYFSALEPGLGRQLWKEDNLATARVRYINTDGLSGPENFTAVGGLTYFGLDDGTGGFQLWQSDGTSAGTMAVVDPSGNRTSEIIEIGTVEDQVLYSGRSDEYGTELFALFDNVDYGDASYLTEHVDDGARHAATGPTLGLLRDAEEDGVESAIAIGDDLDGIDDEDGITTLPTLVAGLSSTLEVDVNNVSSTAKLDAWIDWNHDGDWDDADEQIVDSETVSAGANSLSFMVPSSSMTGSTTARIRVSEEGDLAPTGFAFSGEVEDYVFNVWKNIDIDLSTAGFDDVYISRVGVEHIEVLDGQTFSTYLGFGKIGEVYSINITGSSAANDIRINYDGYVYGTDGWFNLPGGINLDIGPSSGDTLNIYGNGMTRMQYATSVSPAGSTQLNIGPSALEYPIRYKGFEQVTVENLLTFSAVDALNIGSTSFTIDSALPADLSSLTLIDGGSLTAGAMALGSGEAIVGQGTLAGRFSGEAGSLVRLTGDMSVGDAASASGFITRGDMDVGDNALTLLDLNQAVLGSSTTLGDGGIAGALTAANGLLVDFGNNVVGKGTLNIPGAADASRVLMHNGAMVGTNPGDIVLTGLVKGVGTLHNVDTNSAVYSPGFSPAAIQNGSVAYGSGSTTVIEIGGTSPGSSGYDQLNHSGDITVSGGALDVQWINSFTPAYGDVFSVVTWDGSRTGEFTGYAGGMATPSIAVIPRYDANQLSLVTTGLADANLDGQVSFADFLVLQNNFGQAGGWTQGDFNLDGNITFADFLVLQNAFGTVYFT